LTMKGVFLDTIAYGTHFMLFYTSIGIIELQLQIIDTRKPFMISSSQINVILGEDVVLEFELFDGGFVDLSGNDITMEDYHFEGSTLRIHGDYIQRIFTRDPDRSVLILGYTLSANQHITIGYLFIRIASSSN
jgi:hypothetical protein